MRCFTLLLGWLCAAALSAQTAPFTTAGVEFRLAFMENLEFGTFSNGSPRFSVVIAAQQSTRVRLDNQAFTIDALLDSGEVREFFLDPDLIFYLEGSDITGAFGLRVQADRPVQVWARHYRLYFSESTLVLPVAQWGATYRVLAYVDDASASGSLESSIALIADTDGTVVEITPAALVQGSPGRAAGVPYTITLDAGQVYQMQSGEDLSGTLVRALNGKTVGVFSGARISLADVCSATSHLYDQQHPLSEWGQTFPLIPLEGEGGDFIRVLSAEDFTTFTVGCQEYLIEKAGSSFTFLCSAPALLRADKPVAVAQVTRGGRCNDSPILGDNIDSDPSLLMLPPLEYGSTQLRFRRPEQFGVNALPPRSIVQLVLPASAAASLRYNGGTFPVQLLPLPGNNNLLYASLDVDTALADIRADAPIWAAVFMIDDLETMSEHLGFTQMSPVPEPSDIPLPPQLNFLPTDSICPFQIIRFDVPEDVAYAQLDWDFGNGAGSKESRPVTQYTQPGTYTVTLRLWPALCGNPVTYTQNITVLPCPVPPLEPLNITVEGFCLSQPVRVRYSPTNVQPLPPFDGVLSASGVGSWSVPDYTFSLNFGPADSFGLQITAHYIDPWGRDTIYSISIPQADCFDDFSGDFIRATGNCAGLPVRFEYVNGFSPFVGNGVVFHRWDFGDPALAGDTSRSATPVYTFDRPGLYEVSVRVIRQYGDTATIRLPLSVTDCSGREPAPPVTSGAGSTCNSRFYPNPFAETLYLKRPENSVAAAEVAVEVFDATGRRVNALALDAAPGVSGPFFWNDLPAGMYFFRFWCAEQGDWVIQKMVKTIR